jgi:hypothetical protein
VNIKISTGKFEALRKYNAAYYVQSIKDKNKFNDKIISLKGA